MKMSIIFSSFCFNSHPNVRFFIKLRNSILATLHTKSLSAHE